MGLCCRPIISSIPIQLVDILDRGSYKFLMHTLHANFERIIVFTRTQMGHLLSDGYDKGLTENTRSTPM
jgi:hypothetical protein